MSATIEQLRAENDRLRAQMAELHVALTDLFALVEGECPSVLEDDHHAEKVRSALSTPAPPALRSVPESPQPLERLNMKPKTYHDGALEERLAFMRYLRREIKGTKDESHSFSCGWILSWVVDRHTRYNKRKGGLGRKKGGGK